MLFLNLGSVNVLALEKGNATDEQHEIAEDNVENNESDVNQNEETPVAQFSDEKVTITFELDGGTMEQTVYEVEKGTGLGFTPTPEKEGYKFVYWFYDEEFNDYFHYNKPINEDTVVYAKWSKLVDTNEISQDLLNFVKYNEYIVEPYAEDDFEQVYYLQLEYSYYDSDTDEQVIEKIRDLKGIEFFKNVVGIAFSIDLENEIDPSIINNLKKLENISKIDFKGVVPKEVEFGDWNKFEEYNAKMLSDVNNVKNFEKQVIGLLMQLNYNTDHDQAYDNAVEITFQHTINLSNLEFLEPLNQKDQKFKIELAHAEVGKTLIVDPEFVTRNGEYFVRVSVDNPVLLAYYGAHEKLVFDNEYKYLRTDMHSDLRINYYDDMTDEEYDKLTEPAIIEYIDINDIRHVFDPEDYDQDPKFKSVDIFITRVQYDHLVRVNNDVELGLEFVNNPGLILTSSTFQDIPFEDTVDGGGTLPNENLLYYFGYRVMMNLEEQPPVKETYTVTFDSKGGTAISPILNVEKGSTISNPTDPTNGNKIFKGWFTATDVEWNFTSDTVESDLTLYAKWEDGPVETYTVTFDSKNGTAVSPILNVEKGSTISNPTDPTNGDKIFKGWFTATDVEWNFTSDTVESDLTLYAKWDNKPVHPTNPKDSGSTVPHTGIKQNNQYIVFSLLSGGIGLIILHVLRKIKSTHI